MDITTATRAELAQYLETCGFGSSQLWDFREDTLRLMVRDTQEAMADMEE